MAKDLNAVALTAPEARTRMTERDWQRVEKHEAPQAIEHHLKAAKRARDAAQRTLDRREALLVLRLDQVERGAWPPPVERITWRELKPGDVIADSGQDRTVTATVTEMYCGIEQVVICVTLPLGLEVCNG